MKVVALLLSVLLVAAVRGSDPQGHRDGDPVSPTDSDTSDNYEGPGKPIIIFYAIIFII